MVMLLLIAPLTIGVLLSVSEVVTWQVITRLSAFSPTLLKQCIMTISILASLCEPTRLRTGPLVAFEGLLPLPVWKLPCLVFSTQVQYMRWVLQHPPRHLLRRDPILESACIGSVTVTNPSCPLAQTVLVSLRTAPQALLRTAPSSLGGKPNDPLCTPKIGKCTPVFVPTFQEINGTKKP